MKARVKNYLHTPGYHCISTVLQNYFNYYGFNLSEGMAFGLDCGLGFCYRKHDVYSKIPAFYTGGRIYSWVDNICEILNLQHTRKTYEDPDYAWTEAKEEIGRDTPVIAELDKSCLDYWGGVLREVPFHMVLVVGYDDEAGKVWIGDAYAPRIDGSRLPDNLHVTDISCLRKARTSAPHWGDINSAVHKIVIPEDYKLDIKAAIKKAVVKNALLFLEDKDRTGQYVLEEFCSEIVNWPSMLPLKCFSNEYNREVSPLRAQLLVSGKMFDEVGTGGGNFRNIYYKFLKESAEIFNHDSNLSKAADLMKKSSLLWTEAADVFCRASRVKENEIPGYLKEAQKILIQCLESEKSAFEILRVWGNS